MNRLPFVRLFDKSKSRKPPRKRAALSLCIERLEDRSLLSAFSVLNLNDHGAGSLRQAIVQANAHPGADVIRFNVAGTIRLTSGALPAITDKVNMDGTTAPGFSATPLVELDNNHFGGLRFNAGSGGSALRSLAIDNAAGAGVAIHDAGSMLVVGNFIGVAPDGATDAGNGGNGLELDRSSGNTIGGVTDRNRNVISGNHGNGISVRDSSRNQIMGNYIGTDATGTRDLGNAKNGILVTGSARNNTIGGRATGGNDPTKGVFVRPPQGNLISGNNADGVFITGGASRNALSGNFIGTDVSGNSALGNWLDGVAIQNANDNALLGCTAQTNPFIFYNVVSGNGGNGLRVANSNRTTIQANFFGLGADNKTPVGNTLNGVVVEGSSAHTLMGGPIPLGNVTAANWQNGLVIRDTASGFESFNTFAGIAAFTENPILGNRQDGMLITSTGGNNRIRTSVISRNGDNGIEISGAARGVQVVQNIIGLNTDGTSAMSNAHNGVKVGGEAHDILIGGPQPKFSIIPHNVISANGDNGVAVVGQAHDITVNFSFIGTDVKGLGALGNGKAGVLLAPGTHSITIGSRNPNLPTVISGNQGDGIEMRGTHGNTVVGSLIGTDSAGSSALPNAGDGVYLSNSFDNVIGRATSPRDNGTSGGAANVVAFNGGNGVSVASGSRNGIHENSIYGNALLGINLAPGANANQASPVLTSARALPLGTQVSGTLTGRPNTTFTVEFFANFSNEPSGRIFLGSLKVKTNRAGFAEFTFFGRLSPDGATWITATATDSRNNTSEFSAPVTV